MTSATTEPPRSRGGHRAEGHGYGLILFASVLLVVAGCFNLIYGIAAIANSHVFVANAHYVFANLRTWGWITLIVGILLIVAAMGVFSGSGFARWFGILAAGLSAIGLFGSPTAQTYPFWSLIIFALDILVIYALAVYGGRKVE